VVKTSRICSGNPEFVKSSFWNTPLDYKKDHNNTGREEKCVNNTRQDYERPNE
jgi:hypothetical protein